jgi:hypothetical protein
MNTPTLDQLTIEAMRHMLDTVSDQHDTLVAENRSLYAAHVALVGECADLRFALQRIIDRSGNASKNAAVLIARTALGI